MYAINRHIYHPLAAPAPSTITYDPFVSPLAITRATHDATSVLLSGDRAELVYQTRQFTESLDNSWKFLCWTREPTRHTVPRRSPFSVFLSFFDLFLLPFVLSSPFLLPTRTCLSCFSPSLFLFLWLTRRAIHCPLRCWNIFASRYRTFLALDSPPITRRSTRPVANPPRSPRVSNALHLSALRRLLAPKIYPLLSFVIHAVHRALPFLMFCRRSPPLVLDRRSILSEANKQAGPVASNASRSRVYLPLERIIRVNRETLPFA